MATNLQTPILNSRTRSVNFFNGRLLTGDDLTSEQQANRAAHGLLGQAAGYGIAHGLEVQESALVSTVQVPVITVKKGLAVNRRGVTLLLTDDTDISLVRPASGTTASTLFQDCTPVQTGVYVAGAGVYLLTISPATSPQGLASTNGLSTAAASCNSNYNADGVQFRLVQLDITQAELSDTNRLQNLVAYKFFAPPDWASLVTNPFGPPASGLGLLDKLRAAQTITDCEIPLAVLYWTATGGLVFVDMWAVRRAMVPRSEGGGWPLVNGARPRVDGQAMFFQFQSQLESLRVTQASPQTLVATDFFSFLPPVGGLPLTGTGQGAGFSYQQFFSGKTVRGPVYTTDARVHWMLETFTVFPPVDLSNQEVIWLYLVPTNAQQSNQAGGNVIPYLLFASGHTPYLGNSRFDLSRWDLGNYSLITNE
jgi:hypothetical protein